jgi:hypothetical protein
MAHQILSKIFAGFQIKVKYRLAKKFQIVTTIIAKNFER